MQDLALCAGSIIADLILCFDGENPFKLVFNHSISTSSFDQVFSQPTSSCRDNSLMYAAAATITMTFIINSITMIADQPPSSFRSLFALSFGVHRQMWIGLGPFELADAEAIVTPVSSSCTCGWLLCVVLALPNYSQRSFALLSFHA